MTVLKMLAASLTEKLYNGKVTYFERPIVSNFAYPYKVIGAHSPHDFTIAIQDPITEKFEKKLKVLLDQHVKILGSIGSVGGLKEEEARDILKVKPESIYIGMPILVEVEGEGGGLIRGEILNIRESDVDIVMVDQSGVMKRPKDGILPITRDLLRIPKIGINCSLGQMKPPKGANVWNKDRDYAKDMMGAESQVTFLDYYPNTMSYNVCLDVDKINLGIKYFHQDVAMPCDAQSLDAGPLKSYRITDYSQWLGLKIIVFGVKLFQDEKDGDKIKCVLQMEPEVFNEFQGKITNYTENVSDAAKNADFPKNVGSPCLALFAGEYFRAYIKKKVADDKYLLEYVDYKETQVVSSTEMMPIPQEFVGYPEAAVICQLTDLLQAPGFKDVAKLKEMIENKDLYAIIDACDEDMFGSELLVSLYEPTDFTGPDKPFGEILGITDRPHEVHEVLQVLDVVPDDISKHFLTMQTPDPNVFYPGAMISVINSWDSIWITFEEMVADMSIITTELGRYYGNGGSPEDVQDFFMNKNWTGRYVAARQEEDNDNALYRAKVIEEKDGNLKLLYIDIGNVETVQKQRTFPLHKYFVKDPLMAFEVGLK